MNVKFAPTTLINGHEVGEGNNVLEVTVDGKFWGWVDGPVKGQRTNRTWMSLKGIVTEDGDKVADAFTCWNQGHPNQHAAVLAAL